MALETEDTHASDRAKPVRAPSTDETLGAATEGATRVGSATSDRQSSEALARGDALGRYVILDRLGAGAMGVVYSAYDPDLDRKLAIKLLLAADPTELHASQMSSESARLLREAQALAKLSHPNVVAVHDVGVWHGRVFVAMEFVAGQTLRSWLESPRDPRAILAVFTAAGEGLWAAHRAGLIHRDFKPDNVMIGDDERVRVMDFGLARSNTELDGGGRGRLVAVASSPTSSAALRTGQDQLTRTGAIVGTPAYMAPEQHLGLELDARGDQFAFCVSLWEALCGQRPFRGRSFAELALSVTTGDPPIWPSKIQVAAPVRTALLRGLARDPNLRFVDMRALLDALHRTPRTRRWLPLLGASVAVLGVIALGWSQREPATTEVCEVGLALPESTWSDAARARVVAGLGQTQLEFAVASTDAVVAGLDRYAEDWRASWEDACAATHVRHEQSESLLDARMLCLRERERALANAVDVFASADATVARNAIRVVESLPPVAACADLEALTGRTKLDPETAVLEADLRDQLARARVLADAGKAPEAVAALADPLARASTAKLWSTVAELEQVNADAQRRLGDDPSANAALQRGFVAARRADRSDLAAKAAASLAFLVASEFEQPDLAEVWLLQAEAELERAPSDPIRADLEHARALMARTRGEFATAEACLDRALALLEPDSPEHGSASVGSRIGLAMTRGNLEVARGDNVRAGEWYEHALDIAERELGPMHPTTAAILNNLGLTQFGRRDYPAARANLERALEIDAKVLGRDSVEHAENLVNFALVLKDTGECGRSVELLEDSLAIQRNAATRDTATIARTVTNLGLALEICERVPEGRERLAEALEIFEGAFPAGHSDVNMARLNLADTEISLGHHAVALELATRTLVELGDDREGQALDQRSWAHLVAARAAAGAGEPAIMNEQLDRLLALCEREPERMFCADAESTAKQMR